jgi:hypothetical protein
MLARAKSATSDIAITYARVDMEKLELPQASFDLEGERDAAAPCISTPRIKPRPNPIP